MWFAVTAEILGLVVAEWLLVVAVVVAVVLEAVAEAVADEVA